MPSKEDILRDQTNKDQGLEMDKRVFYTIYPEKDKADLRLHRTSKAVALLVKHLHDKRLISGAEIDELLFQAVT